MVRIFLLLSLTVLCLSQIFRMFKMVRLLRVLKIEALKDKVSVRMEERDRNALSFGFSLLCDGYGSG